MEELKDYIILFCALLGMFLYAIILVEAPIKVGIMSIVVIVIFKIISKESS